jgi:hypothetical protein
MKRVWWDWPLSKSHKSPPNPVRVLWPARIQ